MLAFLDNDTVEAYMKMTTEEAEERDRQIFELLDMTRGSRRQIKMALMAFGYDMLHPEQWELRQ